MALKVDPEYIPADTGYYPVIQQPLLNSGGWQNTWLNDLPYWIIKDWPQWNAEAPIDRRDTEPDPEIPVGLPPIQPLPEVEGIVFSNLVIAEQPLDFPTEAPIVMAELIWYTTGNEDPADMQNLIDMGYQLIPVEERWLEPAIVEGTGIYVDTTPYVEEPVSDFFHDLGDLAIDAATAALGLGGPANSGLSTLNPANTVLTGTQTGLPPGIPNTGTTTNAVYKKVCGVWGWHTPKRRRRRALLTESDYNALLRIESLKVNKNMTVAIAKALTR